MASTSGTSAAQDFSQVIYDLVKCFICQGHVKAGKPQWFHCTRAHAICPDCKEGRSACPACHGYIRNGHSRMLEALLNLDKMLFKCENLIRGCREIKDRQPMILHQTECIYRLVNCPSYACKSKVPFGQVLEHMKENKDFRAEVIGNMLFQVKEDFFLPKILSLTTYPNFRPTMIDLESKVFFSVMKVQNDVFYHWISFVGSVSEAKNYAFDLEYTDEESATSLRYTGQAISIDETAGSIVRNGKCLGISRALFEAKFIDDNRNFRYSLTIRNLKEEAKDDDNMESGISDTNE